MGRRGRIRVKGGLPLTAADAQGAADLAAAAAAAAGAAGEAQQGGGKGNNKEGASPPAAPPSALMVDVHGLEMRVRNVYTGAPPCLPHRSRLLLSRKPGAAQGCCWVPVFDSDCLRSPVPKTHW